ncbi:MAG TPA: ATP-binding protein [Rugosimonospora sp.]|nr:ATP-binding protein [Rugosimonospora sp.]
MDVAGGAPEPSLLLRYLPGGVLLVDTGGVVRYANPHFAELAGRVPAEILGRRPPYPWHPDGFAVTGTPYRGSRLLRRADGDCLPVLVSVNPVAGLGAVAVYTDASDLPAGAENALRRLQQAQRLESLGMLAGGVAHDFNNLLAVIINYADGVAQDIDAAAAGDPERWDTSRQDMVQIRRAVDRAIGLTRQLLAFGRREIAQPHVITLNDVVTGAAPLLRHTLGEHVRLVTRLAPDLLPIVADPGQVRQVLVNLAANARDAMPDGGSLVVETANLTPAEEADLDRAGDGGTRHVRLRVCDSGSGMRPDTVERAFEPFFTTKAKGFGAGLGLPTVYGIVTQAGGQAYLESEPGVGTTVTVLLPATSRAPAAPVPAPEPVAAAGGGHTILVVEDEDALREVSRRILARHGYQVLTAADGPEALALAAGYAGAIHLLLTDVVMPEMLGKELATRMVGLRPDTQVLYMSGYAQPILASQGTLDPGVALLHKPFTEVQLLERVRAALRAVPA